MLCILRDVGKRKYHRIVEAECFCGTVFNTELHRILSGHTRSCGCLVRTVNRIKATTHGMYGTRTYRTWQRMWARCSNKNHDKFQYYGGRGIKVCDRWKSFENFIADMGEAPEGKTIDRIDNNAGYFKENCRWVTQLEQCYNKRNTIYLTVSGETLTVYEWAIRLGVRPQTIHLRLWRGWSPERAVKQPLSHSRKSRVIV